MEILLLLFKTRNMNKVNFKELENSKFFKDTVIVEDFNDFSVQLEKKYDFVLFANPNFKIKISQIKQAVQQIENSRLNIVQWSLREVKHIKNNRYSFNNYREIFSSVLLSIDKKTSVINWKTYFDAITYTKEKAYIGSSYIGRDLRNKIYKKDMIDYTISLFENTSIEKLKSIFDTSDDLIKFLDFIVDNQVYEKLTTKAKQMLLMKLINKKLKHLTELCNKEKTQLYLFYRLVFNEYYEEALKSLMLYRSRRYWYHINFQLNQKLESENYDVRKSIAWIKTQKYRNLRIKFKEILLRIEKFSLKTIVKISSKIGKKNIWLITERKDSASDNSYFLFEYINNNRKDITSYYVLDKNSKQIIKKMKTIGKVIKLSSLKHKYLMLRADKYITSFTVEETLIPYDAKLYKKIYMNELMKKDIISIQHGMIIHNISPYLSKKNYLIDYITANNRFEKEIIMETLGYKDDEVLITGMARHDNLIENSVSVKDTNEVLFMPTWQRGLQNLTIPQFLESNFYKKIYEMLNDKNMIMFLKECNLKLNILMHPQFEKFAKHLNSNLNEISFLSMSDVEIPQIIANSKFLITDFSSVAVDFLFQKKNVIFYQHNKYASHHVPSKQIKYSDIGQVVTNLNQLFEALYQLKENDFNLLMMYQKSFEELFEVKKDIREKTINTIMNKG